jgi:hypothetical protein
MLISFNFAKIHRIEKNLALTFKQTDPAKTGLCQMSVWSLFDSAQAGKICPCLKQVDFFSLLSLCCWLFHEKETQASLKVDK